MADLSVAELLEAYDGQLRGRMPERLPSGIEVERDGPLVRYFDPAWRGFIDYRDLGGLTGSGLDELIARQVSAYAARRQAFEWKTHAHDAPPDLERRLRGAGFEPEDVETVMVARVVDVVRPPRTPEGVEVHEVRDRLDLDRIETLEDEIWGHPVTRLADRLQAELALGPGALRILVAEAEGRFVSAGWIRFEPGTAFATLWGGGTLPGWRRQGIYCALVASRAQMAAEQGFRYLEVDASDASRPILERVGFVGLTTTRPYVWTPGNPGARPS